MIRYASHLAGTRVNETKFRRVDEQQQVRKVRRGEIRGIKSRSVPGTALSPKILRSPRNHSRRLYAIKFQ